MSDLHTDVAHGDTHVERRRKSPRLIAGVIVDSRTPAGLFKDECSNLNGIDALLGWSDVNVISNLLRYRNAAHGAELVLFQPSGRRHTPTQRSTGEQDDREEFDELLAAWRAETAFSSSPTEIGTHWAYQRIIGKGSVVLPWIAEDLAAGGSHWHWALCALTGENPAGLANSPGEASRAWLNWLQSHHLVR